jgi:hypothetical protein
MKMNNRIKLAYYAVVTSMLISQSVLAQEAELADKVQACSNISENQSRLSCFDALTDKNSLAVELLSQSVAIEKSPLNEQQIDNFSKDHVKKTSDELAKEINSITLSISTLSKTIRGQWNVTFSNGQKWQQKDTTKLSLKQGDVVVLTKGALGSVYMQKENTKKRIKVKRLK